MSSRFAVAAVMLFAGAVCVLTPVGCHTSCTDNDGDLPDQEYSGGITDNERGVYQSGPWNGPFLEFKPEKTYRFMHGLLVDGRPAIPNVVQVYVGFKEVPLGPDRSVSEAAGNEAIIEEVGPEAITVRNDTCQKFYVRLVASDPTPVSEGVASGMGDGGAAGAAGASESGAAGAAP